MASGTGEIEAVDPDGQIEEASLLANLDLVAEVAGAAIAAARIAAVENWGRSDCSGDLGADVTASLDLVRCGLTPLV